MSQKQLFVSSQAQINMLTMVIIPEMLNGFWKADRPAGHGEQWSDVEFIVTTNNQVGPTNFKVPRNYNFVNPDFLEQCGDQLVAACKQADETLELKHVKRLLIELSRIVGGRLTDLTEAPTKANRGTNVSDGRENQKVMSSGKGLGSPEWFDATKALVAALEEVGAVSKEGRTYITMERGSRKARIFITGADQLAIEHVGGDVIATAATPSDINEVIVRSKIEFTSVNVRKTTSVKGKDGVVVTKTAGGATVRRAAVSRTAVPSAAVLAANNPFGAHNVFAGASADVEDTASAE